MNDNFDDIDPTSLLTLDSSDTDLISPSLIDSNMQHHINQIKRNNDFSSMLNTDNDLFSPDMLQMSSLSTSALLNPLASCSSATTSSSLLDTALSDHILNNTNISQNISTSNNNNYKLNPNRRSLRKNSNVNTNSNINRTQSDVNPVTSSTSTSASTNTNNLSPTNNKDDHVLIIDNDRESNPNQFIDLTKENDDVLIISPRISKSTSSRRTARKTVSRIASQRSPINDSHDNDGPVVIHEVKTTNRSMSLRNNLISSLNRSDPNATIIIDDERNDSLLNTNHSPNFPTSSTRSADPESNEIVQICSPTKRSKLSSTSDQSSLAITSTKNPIDTSENSNLPKCPVCLDNLDELKQRNKRLMATFCGHVLCNLCLDEHFKQSGSSAASKTILCPTCRTRLTKSKIHSLYL